MKTCPTCGQTHDGFFSVCQDCLDARLDLEEGEIQRQQREARAAAWSLLCPPVYRRTDWQHPTLSPVLAPLARDWWPKWKSTEGGLGLWGASGVGKTRCAWAILRRCHFAGFSVRAVDAFAFSRAVQDWFSDDPPTRRAARALIRECHTVKVLLLDDLGKERMKPDSTVPAALHELLEERKRELRPLIWTSERTRLDLAPAFGTNYAEGIINRIREMSHIVHATPPAPVPTLL